MHTIPIDAILFHGVKHFDTTTHQLHQIFVRTDNGNSTARIARLTGQGGDYVVSLVSLNLFASDVKGTCCIARKGHLWAQILGHRITIGFVKVVQIISKCVAAFVKNHRNMGGSIWASVAFNITLKHIAEPTDSTNRHPV